MHGQYFGNVQFNLGFQAGLKAFTAAVLGGIGNIPGAALGGFIIGFLEITVIALVAVVVLGPERLPDLARQAAQLLHRLRGMATNARDELRSELGPEYADLQLRDLDPRTIVRKHISEAMADFDREQAASRANTLPEGQVPPYDVEAT